MQQASFPWTKCLLCVDPCGFTLSYIGYTVAVRLVVNGNPKHVYILNTVNVTYVRNAGRGQHSSE